MGWDLQGELRVPSKVGKVASLNIIREWLFLNSKWEGRSKSIIQVLIFAVIQCNGEEIIH